MGKACSRQLTSDQQQHERLGIVKLLPQGTHVKLKSRIDNIQKFNQWERQMQLLLQDDFRQVLYLPQKYTFLQEGVCGNSGSIEMEFENYQFTLRRELESRWHKNVAFQQKQLWYLLYNILEAAFLLEPLGKSIGDIHPANILINQMGRIKIIPVCAIPHTPTSYEKIIESRSSDVYLAPEQIDNTLIERGIYPHVDACKSEVFSIGMTLLMAASLKDSYEVYDRSLFGFNSSQKKEHFNQIAISYSTYFCSILNQMLQEDPSKRRNASDLFRELNRFQDDILSFRDFNLIQNKVKEVVEKDLPSEQASIAFFLNNGSSVQKGSLIPKLSSF